MIVVDDGCDDSNCCDDCDCLVVVVDCCCGRCRFSIGVSVDGMMAGPSTAKANAMICDFGSGSGGSGSVAQYDMLGYASSQIVLHPTSGVGNMSAYQTGSSSVMMWSRYANNGDANDAGIVLDGVTNVVWAIGSGNKYSSVPMPAMSSVLIDLSGVASATPSNTGSSSVSESATVSPSVNTLSPTPSVSPSGVSASPSPSTLTYGHSAEVTSGLMLYWNRDGDRFDFKAVLSSLAW